MTRPGALTVQQARYNLVSAGLDPDRETPPEVIGRGRGAPRSPQGAAIRQRRRDYISSADRREAVCSSESRMTLVDNARGEDPNLGRFHDGRAVGLDRFHRREPRPDGQHRPPGLQESLGASCASSTARGGRRRGGAGARKPVARTCCWRAWRRVQPAGLAQRAGGAPRNWRSRRPCLRSNRHPHPLVRARRGLRRVLHLIGPAARRSASRPNSSLRG